MPPKLTGSRVFQSAPLTEARGDETLAHKAPRGLACFNPLPLPKQGEIRFHRHKLHVHHEFQSAPLTEARGDRQGENERRASTCFNPLPLPKQGEIVQVLSASNRRRVSIRSPYRSKGRLDRSTRLPRRGIVSIRSPYRSKGRCPHARHGRQWWLGFNPLPLPKQGEIPPSSTKLPDSDVSIRSPYRSKGRINDRGIHLSERVSIRSPYRSKGRSPCRLQPRSSGRHTGFNPLPLPKQGEISAARCPMQAEMGSKFQSAPLTEARGDVLRHDEDSSFENIVSIRSPYRSKGR